MTSDVISVIPILQMEEQRTNILPRILGEYVAEVNHKPRTVNPGISNCAMSRTGACQSVPG